MPPTDFSESESVLAKLLSQYQPPTISNLTFSGEIALQASVERTRDFPVPVWKVKAPLKKFATQLFSGETPIEVDNLAITAGVSGIANHIDIAPMFPRASRILAAGLTLTNVTASIRATEKALMVNEANAGICGGKVSVYSLFLDPAQLNAGMTLFVTDVDAGEALTKLKMFNGNATGRLNGKMKLFIREGGKSFHLSEASLHSIPGEIGKIKMTNPETIVSNLALAGVDDGTRGNIENALSDLDYSVLRFGLTRNQDNTHTLALRIEGSATRGETTVPVNLNFNINGAIEQLVNTGLGYSSFLKGNNK